MVNNSPDMPNTRIPHFQRAQGDPMAKVKRTTHRSSTGTKLYSVRDSNGRFMDIQTYKCAHSADLCHKAKSEK